MVLPTMMVNMALQRDTRMLRFLTLVVAIILLFNMLSFWAVWYWPAVTTALGLYLCFMVVQVIRRDVEYEVPHWLQLGLFVLMFLGALQLVVGIILVAMEEDVGEARRIFQYISLITGPFITISVFMWRTSVIRVFAGTFHATQGDDRVDPRMHVGMSPDEDMQHYLKHSPRFGESIRTDRNLPYAGIAAYGYAPDDDDGDDYQYNYQNQNNGGRYAYRQPNQQIRGRSGSRSLVPIIQRLPPPQNVPVREVHTQPPTADFYAFETDRRSGRPVLVTHTAPAYTTAGGSQYDSPYHYTPKKSSSAYDYGYGAGSSNGNNPYAYGINNRPASGVQSIERDQPAAMGGNIYRVGNNQKNMPGAFDPRGGGGTPRAADSNRYNSPRPASPHYYTTAGANPVSAVERDPFAAPASTAIQRGPPTSYNTNTNRNYDNFNMTTTSTTTHIDYGNNNNPTNSNSNRVNSPVARFPSGYQGGRHGTLNSPSQSRRVTFAPY